MRPELKEFAEAMEKVMQENDAEKGDSWKTLPIEYLVDKMREEFLEFIQSVETDKVDNNNRAKECIDMANVAMMLYHRYKQEEKK